MKDLVLKTNGEYSRGLGAIKVFQIDWVLFLSAILISIAGLVTMNSLPETILILKTNHMDFNFNSGFFLPVF